MNIINRFDILLPALFDKIENPFLDKIMAFFSKIGDAGIVWLIISVAFFFAYKWWNKEKCLRVGISTMLSIGTCAYFGNVVLKPFFARVRPCNIYPEIELLITRPTDFSFPSMHAATSFSVAVILYRYDKRIGIPAIVVATLISLSRVYLHVHYTTDIIAGAVLGTAFALVFYWFFFKLKKKRYKA